MRTILAVFAALLLVACDRKEASQTEPPMSAEEALYSSPFLGVKQARSASGGRNEWVLHLDPERKEIYYGQIVDGAVVEFAEPYQMPQPAPDSTAQLTIGRLAVAFRSELCESDHGGLGQGNVKATVRVDGGSPLDMCMVAIWEPDVAKRDWTDHLF